MSLHLRVGDRIITRLAEDVTFSRGLHGDAACSFRFREGITRDLFDKYAKVCLYDPTSETQYEGRLEDPGRSVDGDGQVWAATAVGESARASDQTVPLIYVDTDLSRWIREQKDRATSATGEVSDVPSDTGQDGLLLQYNPGQPIDGLSSIVMAYRAIEEAGMEIGGIEYTAVSGIASGAIADNFEYRLFGKPVTGRLLQENWSDVPVSRHRKLGGGGTPIQQGDTRLELTAPRTSGGATTINADSFWAAYYDIVVKAARLNLDGTVNAVDTDYDQFRYPFAHEAVIDVLARHLSDAYDVPNATIDTTSTHQIEQLAYPDGITPARLFEDLMALEPEFYWQVGHTNGSDKPTFTWRRWPDYVRYEASMRDGLDLPGNDAEMYNMVTVRWKDKRQRIRTDVYSAGTTIGGIDVPAVQSLDDAGLVRSPELQDISDEMGSRSDTDKFAAEFLLEHGTPPAAGTLTVARKIWDNDKGRLVEPYEIMPGHLIRIRELADSAGDLSTTARDGRCVFRVTGMEYRQDSRAATVELDAPPKTDETDLAAQMSQRLRKR